MLQRKRSDKLRKIFPNLQVPRHFDGYHRFTETDRNANRTIVTAGSSLREKQRHRASLLVGEKNHGKELNDPKNLVASIIQKQKRASELASSKPSSSSSSIDKEKKNAYEIAKIDADVALHQQRINEEKRKIAEKLSSRFRSSSSTTTSAAATTTTTNSNNNTTKSKREPRSTYWSS